MPHKLTGPSVERLPLVCQGGACRLARRRSASGGMQTSGAPWSCFTSSRTSAAGAQVVDTMLSEDLTGQELSSAMAHAESWTDCPPRAGLDRAAFKRLVQHYYA